MNKTTPPDDLLESAMQEPYREQITILMPRLSGSRESARALVTTALEGVEGNCVVIVDATMMDATSQSFADELVLRVLAEDRAAQLIVQGAPAHFARNLRQSFRVRGVASRFILPERKED